MARIFIGIVSFLIILIIGQNCSQFVAQSRNSKIFDSYLSTTAENPYQCQPELLPQANPVKKLLRSEYINTVADLFRQQLSAAELETISAMIPVDQPAPLSSVEYPTEKEIEAYFLASDKIMDFLLINQQSQINALAFTCTALNQTQCLQDWITGFGLRAFRRPLSLDEVQAFTATFQGETDLGEALRVVVMQMINSPFFIYRLESEGVESTPELLHLTQYELASRLSYLLTKSMPDDELLASAQSGELSDPAKYAAHVERLLDSDKFVKVMQSFTAKWLHYEAYDLNTYSPHILDDINLNAEAQAGIRQEIDDFISHIITSNAGYQDFMISTYANIENPEVAKLYGLNAIGQVNLPSSERRGLLSRIAVLANGKDNSSAIHRGVEVYKDILCNPLPPPPSMVPSISFVDTSKTQREIVTQATSSPACIGCHSRINPMGFPLEQFDSLGRFRTKEKKYDTNLAIAAELDIDASTTVIFSTGETDVNGAVELIDQISGQPDATACFAKQWARYSYGREVSQNDGCALAPMFDQAYGTNGSIKEMIKALALSDHFKYRSLTTGGN